jgi:rRNA processing protein Gar1
VAEATPSAEDAPLYRVNIYSDGLKKGSEPDKNLITEMGKTVGKVEGLLGKVDEGFADLQDKKNSLFATLTSKK